MLKNNTRDLQHQDSFLREKSIPDFLQVFDAFDHVTANPHNDDARLLLIEKAFNSGLRFYFSFSQKAGVGSALSAGRDLLSGMEDLVYFSV